MPDHIPATIAVAALPDGFYWFRDGTEYGIIHRLEQRTWRIGDFHPVKDDFWDDAVEFIPLPEPTSA